MLKKQSRRAFTKKLSLLSIFGFLNSCASKIPGPNSTLITSEDDICSLSMTDQLLKIRQGHLTAHNLITSYLKKVNLHLLSSKSKNILFTDHQSILLSMQSYDELQLKSENQSLHGCVINISDNIPVADQPLTYGSKSLEKNISKQTAKIISYLKNKGALIGAKTNLDEFTFGAVGYNESYGHMLNPYNQSYTSGGACGGAAASVAQGQCSFAIGTDASGAVRIPAAVCGIYGFKASLGILTDDIYKMVPTKESLGLMSRSLKDIDFIYNLLRDSPHQKTTDSKIKLCFFTSTLNLVSKDIKSDFFKKLDLLRRNNIVIEEVNVPEESKAYHVGRIITFYEQNKNIEKLLTNLYGSEQNVGKSKQRIQKYLQRRLNIAGQISEKEYKKILTDRSKLNLKIDSIFKKYDAIILPTIGDIPPEIEYLINTKNAYSSKVEQFKRPCELAGVLGLPSLTIPTGIFSETKLPSSIQLIGQINKDAEFLQMCNSIDRIIGQYNKPSFL